MREPGADGHGPWPDPTPSSDGGGLPRAVIGYWLLVAPETGRDPGEQAAYDVARLLVAYPALRRIVEIAAIAGVRSDQVVADLPVPRHLRSRPA